MRTSRRTTLIAATAATATAAALLAANIPGAAAETAASSGGKPVSIEVFAPGNGDNAGAEGKGWFVDMDLDFNGTLTQAAFSGPQLTGPALHANTAPFPGLFATGRDDHLPGLVVLTSTTQDNPEKKFFGPGTNLAGLFNLTGVTNRTATETEIWDTWIVGDAIAGLDVDTTLTVAVMADLNGDGIANDAPNRVRDVNRDGVIDAADLEAIGVASNIVTVDFHINADTAP